MDSEHNMTLLDVERIDERISKKADLADFLLNGVDEEEDSPSPH